MKSIFQMLAVICLLSICAQPAKAQLSYYHDSLRVSIIDTSANPISIQNGVVTTNNITANSIFSSFNVVNAIQLYPSATQQYLKQVYLVVCNCNEMDLKDTLNNYSTIFWGAQGIPKPEELGIANTAVNNMFSLYPNPATDHISIRSQATVTHVFVRSMDGRLIISQDSGKDIDVHALSNGNYLLTVQTGNNSATRLFSKQ